MLDRDLSELYGVPLKRLNENVKRNRGRFAVMLANVLRSPVAVRASIQVVRAFVSLRSMLATNAELSRKVESIERRVGKHDSELQEVLTILRQLLEPPPLIPKRQIGFMPARVVKK